ncbi:MAG: hypothetical protein IPH62_08555 [Ignavibacteriae bacterium]|nr:hypothetical protein [Ignavibacteriota bacterium]
MKKFHLTIFFILFIISQNQFAQDSVKIPQINFIDLTNNSLQNNLSFESFGLDTNINSICVDSLKNINELFLHFKMMSEYEPNLSIANQMIEHNQQREFLMKSISEYYKNQPNYDLGEVGKYLGLAKKYSAFLLLLLSL